MPVVTELVLPRTGVARPDVGVTKTHKRGISSRSPLGQNHPGGRLLNALERPRKRRVASRLMPGQKNDLDGGIVGFSVGRRDFPFVFYETAQVSDLPNTLDHGCRRSITWSSTDGRLSTSSRNCLCFTGSASPHHPAPTVIAESRPRDRPPRVYVAEHRLREGQSRWVPQRAVPPIHHTRQSCSGPRTLRQSHLVTGRIAPLEQLRDYDDCTLLGFG
jgi:hypothetical protein